MKWLVLIWVGMLVVLGCEAAVNSAPYAVTEVVTVDRPRTVYVEPAAIETPPQDQLALVTPGVDCSSGVCAITPVRSTLAVVQGVRSAQPVRSVARGVGSRVRGAVRAVASIRPIRRLFGRGC